MQSDSDTKPAVQSFWSSTQFLTIIVAGAILIGFGAFYLLAKSKTYPISSTCTVDACVSLSLNQTEPQAITIKNGGTVQFDSADGKKHNITLADNASHHSGAQNNQQYSSGEFSADEGWRAQFKQDGTYTFTDLNNSKLKVTVIVYTPGGNYKVN